MVDIQGHIKDIIAQLQHPIDNLQTLLSLLTAPLDALAILPPQFRKYNTHPLPPHSVNIRKHIPHIQRALLEHILPTWDTVLKDHRPDATHLVKQYFCPDPFVNALPVSGGLALKAYETILAGKLSHKAINLLESLAYEYPVDRLWSVVFDQKTPDEQEQTDKGVAVKNLMWEDCVRDVVSVPTKVANAMAGHFSDIPSILENGSYLNEVCRRVEMLVEKFSKQPIRGRCPSPFALTL